MLKLLRNIFLTSVFLLALTSCDRIKRKGHHVIDKTKDAVAAKEANLSDKIIAHCDTYHPADVGVPKATQTLTRPFTASYPLANF